MNATRGAQMSDTTRAQNENDADANGSGTNEEDVTYGINPDVAANLFHLTQLLKKPDTMRMLRDVLAERRADTAAWQRTYSAENDHDDGS